MPIRKLPPLLVNQIAAGEVIERPASVVKELVENSLDAGAKRIDVAIEDGGRQLVRVSDDGCGIPAAELTLAVAPHATSKLQEAAQLAAIDTLGFRGEAMASIASVSRLRITSRAVVDGKPAEAAHTLEASGDDVSEVAPAAAAPGTVVEVRDLFFNTPARRKFLRAASTEVGHISDLVTRVAIAHPHVAFSLSHNGRKSIDLAAVTDRRQRCVDLLGKELEEALLDFEATQASPFGDGAAAWLWGLAGLPSIARATAKHQYFFVNGRTVRDRNLAHALKEAYRGLMPHDRQPVAVIVLEMDPHAVDVNVHPTKAEVRFREPSRVHGMVLTTVRQRLLGADLTPDALVDGGLRKGFSLQDAGQSWNLRPEALGETPSFDFDAKPGESGGAADGNGEGEAASGASTPPQPRTEAEGVRAFVDYFRRMDPTKKGFVYQQVREAMAEDDPSAAADDQLPRPANGAGEDARPIGSKLEILQVHKSYIVTQDEHGIVIVDQHALHERVMFETLRQRILKQGSLESQRLLMPATLPGNANRFALLEQMAALLGKLGVEAAPMGPATIAVHAFPSLLFDRKVDPVAFMEELFDKVEAGDIEVAADTVEEAALHEVIDMMSCKAAVKAGDSLSMQELEALLARRQEIERASNCPHGRPTQIRLTLRELEKQFGRS